MRPKSARTTKNTIFGTVASQRMSGHRQTPDTQEVTAGQSRLIGSENDPQNGAFQSIIKPYKTLQNLTNLSLVCF